MRIRRENAAVLYGAADAHASLAFDALLAIEREEWRRDERLEHAFFACPDRLAGVSGGASTIGQRIFLQRTASCGLANALQAALRLDLGGFVVKPQLDLGKGAFVVFAAHMT